MRNFVQTGKTVTIPAPSAVSSGDVVIVGSLHGIAAEDAGEGDLFDLTLEGCFGIAKSSVAFDVGDAVYWNTASSAATATNTDTLIGAAIEAVSAENATVVVRLAN